MKKLLMVILIAIIVLQMACNYGKTNPSSIPKPNTGETLFDTLKKVRIDAYQAILVDLLPLYDEIPTGSGGYSIDRIFIKDVKKITADSFHIYSEINGIFYPGAIGNAKNDTLIKRPRVYAYHKVNGKFETDWLYNFN